MREKSIFSGPITPLLSMLCVLVKILSRGSRKSKQKGIKVLNFTLLIVFDITAVKGLRHDHGPQQFKKKIAREIRVVRCR